MGSDRNPSSRLPMLRPRTMPTQNLFSAPQISHPYQQSRPPPTPICQTPIPLQNDYINFYSAPPLSPPMLGNQPASSSAMLNPHLFWSPPYGFPALGSNFYGGLLPYLQPSILAGNTVPQPMANHLGKTQAQCTHRFQNLGPTSNVFQTVMLGQDAVNKSLGSYQDLLRSVSIPSTNPEQCGGPMWFKMQGSTSQDVDNNPGMSANGRRDNFQHLETEPISDEESEDEVIEVDADSSDCLADDELENVFVPDIEKVQTNPKQMIEFDFVELNNGGTLTYKKRRRFPKGYHVPDFRPPRDMGAIETAMRRARMIRTDYIFEPKLGMVFDSRAEVYQFYNFYSWEVGFGIRFGGLARNRVNKMRTMQELVCEREGFDARCKQNSKRNHCKAMIRLHRTEDLGWYISKIVIEHNHELSVSCGEKREWNSHSKIEGCTKDMIRTLRENNVTISRVHCILGDYYGGMPHVPFNNKSIRSVCSEIARDQKEDDITKTFEVFRKMRTEDPGFQFSVQMGADNKAKALIWTSGRSRAQYNFFGDAITFDTTYCTNIYKMPFGMFVGVNNHFQSVLFAGVLMTREDTDSFKWVFKEFITLMGGKAPVTIFTDQCKAMTKAIKEVFGETTTHLWCKWHVLRHAPEHLGPAYKKKGALRRDFHYLINQMLTIDEFEKAWEDLIETYNLKNNDFMQRTYEKREKWAKPWARETFCARMASTQRSESANSILKKVVPRNATMNRFVQQYDKLLFMRASAEEKAEHETKQFVHRTNRFYPIEKHAISVYTKNTFQLFKEEVDKSTQYIVKKDFEENTYLVIHNNAESRKTWARVIFKVTVKECGQRYCCECGQYEHFGMLCCHCLKVMIDNGVKEIPQAHIMKRWTRNARDYEYPSKVSTSAGEQLGQSILFANALDVVKSTDKNPIAEDILTKHLSAAKKEIEIVKTQQPNYSVRDKGKKALAYLSETGTDADYDDTTESEAEQGLNFNNAYGASGSSAYMSDADINNIKAPDVEVKVGRKRETRPKGLFEKKRKAKRRYIATQTLHEDDEPGYVIETLPRVVKPKKKKAGKK